MARPEFVHLHVHSEYSLLDGAIRVKELIGRALELGMPAVALTDHGNMYGALEFYTAAVKAGVKPLVGFEGYLAEGSRHDRTPSRGAGPYHLTLLARDATGYRNLCRLSSLSHLEGFYYKPRFDWELLAECAAGVLVLTGCLKGAATAPIAAGNPEAARQNVGRLTEIFGRQNVFVEIQDHGLAEQRAANPELVRLARRLDLPLAATNDCHYLARSDAAHHDVLLAIQTGRKVTDQDRLRFTGQEFYFKDGAEMAAVFEELPEALAGTLRAAELCDLKLDLGKHILPDFPVPEGLDHAGLLRRQAEAGLARRLAQSGIEGPAAEPYRRRLDFELGVISEMEFPAYFLVVADFIDHARSLGIPVGPGRGSAAGSLVAYSLGITGLDPLRYSLYFERFLNPSRISMPDIDIDFCAERRDEVIDYVARKYGKERVAHIITFGTMKARAVIRDVARALDFSYGDADRVAKLVPASPTMTLEKAYQLEPELAKLRQGEDRYQELLAASEKIEGLARHASTHAAGVVIARDELTNYLPLTRDTKGGLLPVTQFSMKWVDELGLLKVDFLGLNNLTILDRALKIVRRTRGIEIDLDAISLEDPATYRLISAGETFGVFQLESSGMRAWLRRLKPNRFEDIIAMVALYRPGPMDYIPTFVDSKAGLRPITYLDPCLEPILKETYGVAVYQEQLMAMVQAFAGFSLAEADQLRKAVSKKKVSEVEELRAKFVTQAAARGKPRKVAEEVFAFIEPFAGYGFNKSHATAYALIAYQTAFMKVYHPVEFMAAYLSSVMGDSDSVLVYIRECRQMKIPVLPPDVNESFSAFTVVGGSIRFGLGAVKNLGSGAVEAILAARKAGGPFQSIYDFCDRVDLKAVNRRVVESLVKCGAFDSLKRPRAQLVEVIEAAIAQGAKTQADRESGQASLFGLLAGGPAGPKALAERYPDAPEWSRSRLLVQEKEALGFYITGHPLMRFRRELARCTRLTSACLAQVGDGEPVRIGGLVSEVKRLATKKGEAMATMVMEDLAGTFRVVLMPQVFADHRALAVEQTPLFIEGRMSASDRDLSVRADKLSPLGEALGRSFAAVQIRLAGEAAGSDRVDELKALLGRHPGRLPVRLAVDLPDGEGVRRVLLRLPAELAVDPSDAFMDDAEELLGDEAVQYV